MVRYAVKYSELLGRDVVVDATTGVDLSMNMVEEILNQHAEAVELLREISEAFNFNRSPSYLANTVCDYLKKLESEGK